MKCLLDLDGVLVDTIERVFNHLGLPNFYADPNNHGNYSCLDQHHWDSLGHDFWADAPLMPDAYTILHRVETVFGHDNICLLTKPTTNHECVVGKIQWVKKNLPKYNGRYLIGSGKFFCAHEKSVLIDDHDKNVDDFIAHGGKAILLPRKWNRRHFLDPIETLENDLLCISQMHNTSKR